MADPGSQSHSLNGQRLRSGKRAHQQQGLHVEWTCLDLSSVPWGENPGDSELVRAPLSPLCAQLWSVPGQGSGGAVRLA